VRLLLDAQLSDRGIGEPLRGRGHDVAALQADTALKALSDENVLALATDQGRVLVTRNARDFAPLARRWASRNRSHAGLILIWTLQTNAFDQIVERVDELCTQRAEPDEWLDLVLTI
jgi:predicted nuclease of predicted toxin-antitoxin system